MPVGRAIEPAGDRVYMEADVEIEDLEYVEDPRICRSKSRIVATRFRWGRRGGKLGFGGGGGWISSSS